MKKFAWTLSAMMLTGISASAFAAPTDFEFETVTAITMDGVRPTITGVLRNSTAPTTLAFRDETNVSFRYVVNRCVPIFLTMMEKPGKYYLLVVVDHAVPYVQLVSCTLQVRA
jgi:hypothetical protein